MSITIETSSLSNWPLNEHFMKADTQTQSSSKHMFTMVNHQRNENLNYNESLLQPHGNG